ncbi:MAG: FHA domain-containing protein [Chloroflexota bacterium]|nr:FHA domain-containing protein [Chloroflexota bacterium]
MFRLGVQPAEIGRRLEHALLGSRRTSMGHVIGANHYVITLHPDDFSAFASWQVALARELENWLGEVAFRHGVTMLGSPQVVVESDPALARRMIHVVAGFSAASVPSDSQPGPIARLIPLSGEGNVIVLTGLETAVGRATGNDLVISAAEVSREHARLRRDGNVLEVRDLGSRNGTWVNGVRISTHRARSGDEIAFGTLRYRLDLP